MGQTVTCSLGPCVMCTNSKERKDPRLSTQTQSSGESTENTPKISVVAAVQPPAEKQHKSPDPKPIDPRLLSADSAARRSMFEKELSLRSEHSMFAMNAAIADKVPSRSNSPQVPTLP